MKPSVDRLPELAWARIERDVFARLDAEHAVEREPARPRLGMRWWWLAVPMVASLIALVLVARNRAVGDRVNVEWLRIAASSRAFDRHVRRRGHHARCG